MKACFDVLWNFIWPVFMYQLIYLILMAAVAIMTGTESAALAVQAVAALISVIILCIVYIRRYGRKEIFSIGCDCKNALIYIAEAVVLGVCCCLFFNCIFYVIGLFNISDSFSEISEIVYSPSLWIQIATLGVFAPALEEMIFRGFGYRAARKYLSVFPAVFISAFLFGIYHGNLLQGLYAFFIALILAYVRECMGSVLAVWFVHSSTNLTSVLLTYSGLGPVIFEGGAAAAVTVITGLAGIGMIYLIRHLRRSGT